MNIWQRLNEVRKAVSYIQKDARVSGSGNYAAITHDAVTAAVRDHLVSQGVMLFPTLVASKLDDTGTTTQSGVPIVRYEATYDIAFVNCDMPDDRLTMRIESHALDQGDKAPGKAISYATKYAILKVFSIETGEGEEERIPAKGKDKGFKHLPTDGCWDNVPKERHEPIRRIASGVIDYFSANNPEGAFSYLNEQNIQGEELVALWTLLDAKQKRKLKDLKAESLVKEPANA